MNIDKNIKRYMKDLRPFERYASFDYCYNYFQSFRENNCIKDIANSKNIEVSCLQLSLYLASWGMYRGSTYTLQKSSRFYEQLIKNISKFDEEIWDIDVDDYNNDSKIGIIIQCKEMIHNSFGDWKKATDTLISKIMLGVFGVIPAYDTLFKKGCRANSINSNGIKPRSLKALFKFYSETENQRKINKWSKNIHTLQFLSGKETILNYPKAKIIDMIFFIEGKNL